MNEKVMIVHNFIKTRWFSKFPNEKSLRKHQQKLFKEQLSFIKQNSTFYERKDEIPIIDKKIFMDRFNDINTVGIDKNQAMDFAIECEKSREFNKKLNGVTVGLSSGTSGHRGVFLVSDRERAMWAGTVLAKLLPKWHLFGVRVAFFMRANSELYETVQSSVIKFKFFDMLKNMDENLNELQEFQPTLLVAPPSCLLRIAEWNNAQKIKPKKVISIAEVLEQADAEIIKVGFNANVIHQVYQCTEGFLGTTCEYGTLHINEDVVQIEKEQIDESRFIPIVTDLKRRAQPIIHYRLNDVLVEKTEPCNCGSPFLALEKIEGRQDDVFEFDGVSIFPDFIRRCILFAEDVGEYRVQQVSANEVVVLAYDLNEATKQQIISEFEKLAKKFQFAIPNITFKPYEYNNRKKLKRVEKLC